MFDLHLLKPHWIALLRSRSFLLLALLFSAVLAHDFYQRLWVKVSYSAKQVSEQVPVLAVKPLPLPVADLAALWPNLLLASSEQQNTEESGPDHAMFKDKDGSYRLVAVFAKAGQKGQWLARVIFTSASEVKSENSEAQGAKDRRDLILIPGQQIGRFVVESISINTLQLKAGDEVVSLYLFKPTSRNEAPQ